MTEMINGHFMDDLAELLTAATRDQRKRKTIHETDAEFEKMGECVLKNFTKIRILWTILRSSL